MSGCKEAEEVPILKEPVAVNQAFRPVERRTIGKIKVSVGNVVAKEYCHSYKKVTTIKEIRCNVGDYVEEGQVLAVSDVKEFYLQHFMKQDSRFTASISICLMLTEEVQQISRIIRPTHIF